MKSVSPFSNPIFRKLFSAQLFALSGSGLSTIALALLANDLAGGNAGQVLGFVLTIKMIAYVILAPLFAAHAHRFSAKWVLVVLDLVRALVVAMMFFVDEVWQIYVLIFILHVANAGFTPLFQSLIPQILENDNTYTKALSYSRLAYELENLLSPVLAGLLLFVLTFSDLFLLNAIAFLASAAFVLFSGLKAVAQHRTTERLSPLFGLSAYLRTPRLRALLLLMVVVSLAGSMVIVNSVVISITQFGGSQHDLTLLLASYGVGAIIAAFALPSMLNMRHDRTIMLAGGFFLIAGTAAGGLVASFVQLLVVWCFLGFGNGLVMTPAGRLLKRSSNNESRSAIFAAQFSLSHACWLVAYPAAGWLPSFIGMENVFFIFAGLAFLAWSFAIAKWKPVNAGALSHTHEAFDHDHMHVHDKHHDHDHEGWEGPEPHAHPHHHMARTHAHEFVIDAHHHHWPR